MAAGHVVLLRAVNVGGAKLPMARLREIAEGLGATDVSTYIASGNLLCNPPDPSDDFDRALEQAVLDEFGFFREVISRTPDALSQALAAYPFGEASHGHIYFLTGRPEAAAAADFCAQDFGGGERLRVIDRDLHIDYPGGAGTTKLTPQKIAKGLGFTGTGRNLRTTAKLIELAGGGGSR
ncbi:DUF1697 domain-containing protein [Gordonia sp. (in: high G+C Gram-positive bacteria)]|uniref:DUF1697 domain-containing protein n=1 Tax=Gordonia sp. (in: high G+C Gram-positive bacteria) TaxID=84139 RepID=UPI0016AB6626|nr:DUF1697 domain-containing protein [Gordonia sp. (in: high G+C Gram-positive bacteria)]NLG45654.1 DUF1697 domain-containing protein [Gordonia sp. (in: high G+C Gram-positive bacteria)]